MGIFEFILLILVIITVGEVLTKVGVPLVDKLGDVVKEMSSGKRSDREVRSLDSEVVEELERRLARIEDRLDFLEELRAPDRRRALGGGHGLDRGGGRRGEMAPGTEPERGSSPTDERTAGEP